MTFQSVTKPAERCPCCGYLTLRERAGFEICPVCFWEDDGQDDKDCDEVRGGPNGSLSLTQARRNFSGFGASDRESLPHVRKPTLEEIRQAWDGRPGLMDARLLVFLWVALIASGMYYLWWSIHGEWLNHVDDTLLAHDAVRFGETPMMLMLAWALLLFICFIASARRLWMRFWS